MAFLLKDYTGIEPLGKGGMGAVYLASQISLDRKVVIKKMDPKVLADSSNLKQFEYEARSVASLNHDNIIRVYDFGEDNGHFHISMEYVDGPNLQQMLSWDPFPRAIGLMIALQAIKGLHFAHKHSIIHRDFKPNNILISKTGTVKVADFGIAYTTSQAIGADDFAPVFLTLEYAPPELNMDTGIRNNKGDIWAVGVLLYHIICGKLPYSGENPAQLMSSIVSSKEEPVDRCVPWLPEDLVKNINDSLIKDPIKRVATLEPIIESLQILISDMGVLDIGKHIERYIADHVGTSLELERVLLTYHIRKGNETRAWENVGTTTAHLDEAKRIMAAGPHAAPCDVSETLANFITATGTPSMKTRTLKRIALVGISVAVSVFLAIFLFQKYMPDIYAHAPYSDSYPIKMQPATPRAVPASPLPTPTEDAVNQDVIRLSPHATPNRRDTIAKPDRVAASDSGQAGEVPVATREKPRIGAYAVVTHAIGHSSYNDASAGRGPTMERVPGPPVRGNGLLHIYSSPWSEVYIDNAYQGTAPTPRPISLLDGEHSLRLQREGYKPYVASITISTGDLKRIQITLEK